MHDGVQGGIVAVPAAAIVVVLLGLLGVATARHPRIWPAALGTALLCLSVLVPALSRGAASWDGALNAAGYALVFVSYPDGRIRSRRLLLPLAAYLAWAAALPMLGRTALQPWAQAVTVAGVLFAAVLVRRYRRRLSTHEREQVRWALLGAIVTFFGMTTLVIVLAASGASPAALGTVGDALAVPLILALPVALVIGLVRPRLAPVDIALFQAVRIALCTLPVAILSGLFIGVLRGAAGAWLAVATTAIAAVPLWLGAGRLAAGLVYRGRLSPSAALRLLDQRLSEEHAPEETPLVVAEVTRTSLGVATARVRGDGLRTAVAGAVDSDDAAAPIFTTVTYGGIRIAEIGVSVRPAETELTAADRVVLGVLAARSAPALHAVGTVTALVAARAGLVIAHEEERKRLRRDLHDDLAPTLVGLRLTASGAASLLREPAGATPLDHGTVETLRCAVAAIAADVDAAIAQTRALAYGLRPPALDDGGLVAAIRDRARSDATLRIDVQAPDTPLVVSAAVEIAALRVVQEAVTNVRRHADATRCEIRLERTKDALRILIEDDGHGMPPTAVPGLGLPSMHQRAAELGGSVRFGRASLGGVRVAAMIPEQAP